MFVSLYNPTDYQGFGTSHLWQQMMTIHTVGRWLHTVTQQCSAGIGCLTESGMSNWSYEGDNPPECLDSSIQISSRGTE